MAISSREMWVVLRARDEASRVFRAMGGNIRTLGKEQAKIAELQRARGAAMITIGVGVAAAGAIALNVLNDMTNASIEYTQAAALALTQTDGVATSLGELKEIGRDVGRAIPVVFDQIQGSMYDIFSSMDVNMSEARLLLTEFSRAAVAGQTDLQTAGRATISVLNAYKLPASDVNRVNDIMFQLVRKGVGTYEEFSKAIGRAIPASVRAGQEFETLAGMMAFLTRNGLSTAMAATSSARALEAVANPRTVRRLEEMGITVKDTNGEFRPLVGILGDVNTKMSRLTSPERAAALQNLFRGSGGTIQARRFFDVVFENFEEFEQRVIDMERSAGVLDEAYQIMFEAPQSQIQLMTNKYQAMRTEIGDKLVPVKMALVDAISKVLDWWNDLSPTMQSIISYGAALVAAFTTLAGVIIAVSGASLILSARLGMTTTAFIVSKAAAMGLTVANIKLAASLILSGKGGLVAQAALAKFNTKAGRATKAATAFGLAVAAMYGARAVADAIQGIDRTAAGLEDLDNRLRSLSGRGNVYNDLFGDLKGMSDTFQDVGSTVNAIADKDWLDNLLVAAHLDATGLEQAEQRFRGIDEALTEMVRSGDTLAAEEAFKRLRSAAVSQGASLEDLMKLLPEYQTATQAASREQEYAAELAMRYAGALDGTEESLEDVTAAIQEYLNALAEADASFIDLQTGYDDLIEKNQALAQAAADATDDTEDSWEDFIHQFPFTVDAYLAELERMVADQTNWETNMLILSSRVSQEMIDALTKMGVEGAPLVAELVNASDEELQKLDDLFYQRGTEATQAWANSLADPNTRLLLETAAATLGTDAAAEIARKLAEGTATVEEIMYEYELVIEGIKPTIRIDTTQAAIDLRNFVRTNSGMKIYVDAVGRTTGFSTGAGNNRGVSTGGYMLGPGTETSDSIPAMLSRGEFVMRAAAVKKYGLQKMFAMNALRLRDGGYANRAPVGSMVREPEYAGVAPYTKQIDVKVDLHTTEIVPREVAAELGWAIAKRVEGS